MRKILLLTMIALFSASSIFAQNSVLRDAKRSLAKDDLAEARTLIQQAAKHEATANNPETWKVMGDIGNKAFDLERVKTELGQNPNEKVLYDGLMESFKPYLKADSLAELPDSKGRVKNRVRKDIVSILRANYPFYINGGVFYNKQANYSKAADFFEVYWDIPFLPMYENEKEKFLIDSTFQTIKYYAIITSVQAKEHERALRLLKRAMDEPFIENSAYQESDLYELMAAEYLSVNDSASYLETLNIGADKFPQNKYFVPNLVNVFIRSGNPEKALEYLDQAIKNDPNNACDLNSVKGALLAESGDYEAAEAEYNKALAQDPDCERALEALAVNFILQAQNLKDETALLTDRQQQMVKDKETVEFYQKALPLLEKYSELLKAREAHSSEIESALHKLRNVYYNLSSMGVDKSEELDAVEKLLNINNNN